MPSKLSRTSTLDSGDLVTLYKTSQGDFRGIPKSDFITDLKKDFGTVNYITQREVVATSGFNVNVVSNGGNIWLILNLVNFFGSGTITLPPLSESVDGQEVQVFCTRQVTTLTINGNGAVQVLGAPSSLAAESFFTLRFDSGTSSWYGVSSS